MGRERLLKKRGKGVVCSLKVVNGVAERGVALQTPHKIRRAKAVFVTVGKAIQKQIPNLYSNKSTLMS